MTAAVIIAAVLLSVSIGLNVWQWLAGRRFPLHQSFEFASVWPSVTALKPLKGKEPFTEACLRSWMEIEYPMPVQILFGVRDAADPVCDVVRQLMDQYPKCDARLVVCPESTGANPKVSTLMQLEPLIEGEMVVISDDDIRVPRDYLKEAATLLQREGVGLVNSFYRLANPANLAVHLEASAINCDFWSQVCQSNTMRPMRFALGAVMSLKAGCLKEIGGFRSLAGHLADDNRLGRLVDERGKRIVLTQSVVDCHTSVRSWKSLWDHQVRWARTVRVCEPGPYFFSILANPMPWFLLTLLLASGASVTPVQWLGIAGFCAGALLIRLLIGWDLWKRLTQSSPPRILVPSILLKDLIGIGWWISAFTGNRILWRGSVRRLRRDGTIQ